MSKSLFDPLIELEMERRLYMLWRYIGDQFGLLRAMEFTTRFWPRYNKPSFFIDDLVLQLSSGVRGRTDQRNYKPHQDKAPKT